MSTAIEARDALSKIEGVIRVHPNGLNGKTLVFVKDKKDLDETKVKEALKGTKKLLLRKMQLTTVSV
jgi:hypothetical protein